MDGQDDSVDDSDCSSTVADEGGPPTASPPPREDDLRGGRRQQVRQPDLLKKTPLDPDSNGGKPDELTGPTTKTDLSGDVTEAAGREVTSPDPLGPHYQNIADCVRCWHENEDKKWQEDLDNLSSSSDNRSVSEKGSH